ncbi:hypothetical protein B0H16DRAFT_1741614 [Mycena metata]|uniref:Uncharacterized protein n=1 Tax=Mycena metata TaxID=1033252 RepID=A0AAD7MGB2_9AGAR|nr:hypothetical protein B0H16DRAFT_1741614 [Mycena metata]
MDPLQTSDLHKIEKWDAYVPDMKGYVAPQQLELLPACASDIATQITTLTREENNCMRNTTSPFLALSVSEEFPATSLTIDGETLTVPVSSREMTFLGGHLGDPLASRQIVSPAAVQISDRGQSFISKSLNGALANIGASHGNYIAETTLASLEVFKTGFHKLLSNAENDRHIATLFVALLVLFTGPAIQVCATHDNFKREVTLPQDLSRGLSVVAMYAGVSDAYMTLAAGCEVICLTYHLYGTLRSDEPSVLPRLHNLSGALPPLCDAFCTWRHCLNSGAAAPPLILFFLRQTPTSATEFEGADATLLCHLAPLAKAYGFNLYLGNFTHTLSSKQTVPHEYKEYDEEIDMSQLELSDDPDEDFEVDTLRRLDGARINLPALVKMATALVETDDVHHEDLIEIDLEQDYEVYDQSIYDTTVIYSETRTVTLLFLAP